MFRSPSCFVSSSNFYDCLTCQQPGAAGFEPANNGSKGRCLTAWRRPNTGCGLRLRMNGAGDRGEREDFDGRGEDGFAPRVQEIFQPAHLSRALEGDDHRRHVLRFVGFPEEDVPRSEEHTSELQSQSNIVWRLLL